MAYTIAQHQVVTEIFWLCLKSLHFVHLNRQWLGVAGVLTPQACFSSPCTSLLYLKPCHIVTFWLFTSQLFSMWQLTLMRLSVSHQGNENEMIKFV